MNWNTQLHATHRLSEERYRVFANTEDGDPELERREREARDAAHAYNDLYTRWIDAGRPS